MFKNKKRKEIALIVILIISIIIYLFYNIFLRTDSNSTYALSKYGSRSDEVKQIQTKLKRWGYYNGNVDGIYGSQTLSAVKWFQSKNGLTVDRNSRNENTCSNGDLFFKQFKYNYKFKF